MLARRGDAETAPAVAPITVDRAVTDYAADLKAGKGEVYNAQWPKVHLTRALLAELVQLLTAENSRPGQ